METEKDAKRASKKFVSIEILILSSYLLLLLVQLFLLYLSLLTSHSVSHLVSSFLFFTVKNIVHHDLLLPFLAIIPAMILREESQRRSFTAFLSVFLVRDEGGHDVIEMKLWHR
jgi:hypothetical protein